MVIDLILDRKDGKEYDKNTFFKEVLEYSKDGNFYDISNAFGMGSEKDVKNALCDYIDRNEYNPAIKAFIKQSKWL
jgi:uncharacterized metal-binding protein